MNNLEHNDSVEHQIQLAQVRCQLFVFQLEYQLPRLAIWQVGRGDEDKKDKSRKNPLV